MAKRGYKQGAMSATDAITQLRAAAAKCDNKWMKAHAASARFFGAREADVKHALKRCGTIKSSLMGAKKPRKATRRKRGVGGLQGTTAQHMEAGLEYLSLARNILARAEATPAYTEKRQDEALKALHYATEAVGECGWAPQEGLVCRREGRELVERATRLVKKRVESTGRGRGVRGLKGSSPQHATRAKLEGADRVFTDGFALDGTRKRRRRRKR